MKRWIEIVVLAGCLAAPQLGSAQAASSPAEGGSPSAGAPGDSVAVPPRQPSPKTYILSPNDLIEIKVYQEDDLTSTLRIAKDGTVTFPLVGTVTIGGKNIDQACAYLRGELMQGYLVNPQVSMTIMEYAKRRFTVMGQVQRPGTYELPSEEKVDLLQAIAMAGGYTRIANQKRVDVTRQVGDRNELIRVNAEDLREDPNAKPFEILQDDIINVKESVW